MIKIIYVYHDCFVVKTEEAVLVFDFWKDPYQAGSLPNPLAEVDADMPVYVFVSHGHKDHYNPEIFRWAEHFGNIRYIVSRDVERRIRHIISPSSSYKGPKVDAGCVVALSDRDSYSDAIISVSSFPSTDIGNSYAVKVGGYSLFHAGDLNAWIWKDESSAEEVERELERFNAIVSMIAADFAAFDFCFFPVDSRIGTDYFTGALIFLQRLRVENFFAMHYELAEDRASLARRHRDAADFGQYASHLCGRYLLAAPYSVYATTDKGLPGSAL